MLVAVVLVAAMFGMILISLVFYFVDKPERIKRYNHQIETLETQRDDLEARLRATEHALAILRTVNKAYEAQCHGAICAAKIGANRGE